jgi:hypothetical protein
MSSSYSMTKSSGVTGMKFKTSLSIAVFAFIASCTTFEDIDGGLNAFRGQNADSLISVIGYPDGERTVAGRRLLVWNTDETVTSIMPVTNYQSGSLSAYGSGGYGYGSYTGTTTSYVPTTSNYVCTLLVEIDRNNKIIGHDFEGNIGGCERYAAALRPYIPPTP